MVAEVEAAEAVVCSAGSADVVLFLASIRDAAEAGIALEARADIIDVKEPRNGALGAADTATIKAILKAVDGRAPVSATIGDLPMRPDTIRDAVLAQGATGVDYVKFGLFPGGQAKSCLDALAPVTRNARLIMVMFADRPPAFDAICHAAAVGMSGVMLDTADKSAGSLRHRLDAGAIASFVRQAKAHDLAVGLAGSLTAADIPDLLVLEPDLLGFRGALCAGSRDGALDPRACAAIRALIPERDETAPRRLAKLNGAPARALC